MMPWRRVVARIRELLRSSSVDRDMSEELQSHLDHLTDEYVRRGLDRDRARERAVLDFGGAGGFEGAREAVRDARGLPLVEQTITDVRRAVRSLLKTRAFTCTAIVTLALGIGVSTAVFSLLDHVVLRPLPYEAQDRLVSIWEARTGPPEPGAARPSSLLTSAEDVNRSTVAPAAYLDFKAKAPGFAAMAGYAQDTMTLSGAGAPEQLFGETVTAGYFGMLGGVAIRGRLLGPIDEQASSPAVVVISHGLWRRRFAGDENIIGRAITLNNRPLEVVGVMAPGFTGLTQFSQAEPVSYWVTQAFRPDLIGNYGDHEISVAARLADGVTVADAQRSLTAVSEDIERRAPSRARWRAYLRPLGDDVVRRVRGSLTVIMLMVGFILLIACVNVANLLIVRGAARRREVAIRYALGATRRRVLTEMLTESVVLATAGGAAGVLIAWWLKDVLVSLAPPTLPRLSSVTLDGPVLLFSVAVALVTGLVFGAPPAWQARRAQPLDSMSSGERVHASRWMMRWRNALMVFEIAISTVLLIGAGLMVRSLLTLNGIELGFRTQGVLAIKVALPEQRYPTGDARLAFFQNLETRLRRIPGVSEVGYTNNLPMRGAWGSGFMIDGRGDAMVTADFQAVSTGYFSLLDIPLRRGRLLNSGDVKSSEPVAVVSEVFSRRLLDGENPLGRRFRRGPKAPWITIVGVVADIRRDGKRYEINPQVFLPAAQTQTYPTRLSDIAVRFDGRVAAASGIPAAMRAAVAEIDPAQPVSNVRTLEEVVSNGARDQRFQAVLLGSFAALALVLAMIGVHGVVSYLVSLRTREIGVRMALGAGAPAILRSLVTATGVRVLAGAVIGLAGAAALSKYIASLLFQVTPTDLVTYAGSAVVLMAVAMGAALLAARRATAIDPVKALRAE